MLEAGDADLRRQITALLPDLRGFARFLVRDRVMADDVVQDTLVRALAAGHQFEPGTNLKAWLFTILRNQFYEQARRRRREADAIGAHFEQEEGANPAQLARAELNELQSLIWKLPPLMREALILVGAQEMTHEEAAAICKIPVGTMKARLSRARTQLVKLAQAAETV